MKYKVGDKVKIKEDLIVNEMYDKYTFYEEKAEFKGKITTVKEVYEANYYELDIDNGKWCWTDGMLEDYIEASKSITAIDKAWEENLKLDAENQFESKESIIELSCPCYNEFTEINLDEPKYCLEEFDKERCKNCWNREINEESNQEEIAINKNDYIKLTFDKLYSSSISGIVLDDCTEQDLIESLRKNDFIIHTEGKLDYNDIPTIINWLQNIYEYTTELKNKVNYVGWKTARVHMEQGNKAKYDGVVYVIKDNDLYYINKSDAETYIHPLYLKMLDSKEWILL